jgi:hypothetical protein
MVGPPVGYASPSFGQEKNRPTSLGMLPGVVDDAGLELEATGLPVNIKLMHPRGQVVNQPGSSACLATSFLLGLLIGGAPALMTARPLSVQKLLGMGGACRVQEASRQLQADR